MQKKKAAAVYPQIISRRLRDWEQFGMFEKSYTEKMRIYKLTHPTQRLTFESPSGYAGTFRH